MLYLLDTNAISDLMGGNPKLHAKVGSLTAADRVGTCTIARGEILFGIEQLPHGKRRNDLLAKATAAFSAMMCESVPEAAADHYAKLKQDCRHAGLALDENDLWIAATTLALGAVLVTRDRDFSRIPVITLEDWTT